MTLQALSYFQTLANYRNFSKAAASLFISQSALSHSIQALEEELGVQLFQRQGRESVLTTNGQQLLSYAQEIFSNIDNLRTQLSNKRAPYSKPLRITVKMGLYPLPDMLKEFCIRHPDARFEIHQSDQVRMPYVPWDFSFQVHSSQIASPCEVLLFDESFQLVVHRNHPLAAKSTVFLKDLEPYPGIQMLMDVSSLQDKLEQAFRAADFHPSFHVVTDHFHFVLQQLYQNRGWALMPRFSLLPKNDPLLIMLPVEDLSVNRYVSLVRNPDHFFSQAMQEFQLFAQAFFLRYKEEA